MGTVTEDGWGANISSGATARVRRPLIAVVDDDSGFAGYLQTFLGVRGYEARVYSRGDEIVAAIRQGYPPDVVLLDVAMPGLDGLHLADELHHQPQPPAVVFVTAHGEHALRAFELEATDYLTKPVRRERLQSALMRVAQRRQPAETAAGVEPVLVVSDRGRVLRVPAGEVLYLKAELKYVTLRTAAGEWVLDEPLNDLEQRLGRDFIRVHRNALVALRAVRALERHATAEEPLGWAVLLHNGERLSVSRRQLTAVRDSLAARSDAD
jgi:two-component system response regulator AlgR